jgi:acetyltransferase-like isoleucine patch superfamily enzyme
MYYYIEKYLSMLSVVSGRIRSKLLNFRGAKVKQKAILASGCKFVRPWGISIGIRFVAEHNVHFKLVHNNAKLIIGDYVFVGCGTVFDVLDRIIIGDHCLIAPNCFFTDHNHGINANLRIDQQPCESKRIEIGNDVWIGAGVIVLPGVIIGDGAIVGANAVVTKDIPSMGVTAGIPSKLLYLRNN